MKLNQELSCSIVAYVDQCGITRFGVVNGISEWKSFSGQPLFFVCGVGAFCCTQTGGGEQVGRNEEAV
jgi:hypothetical protein